MSEQETKRQIYELCVQIKDEGDSQKFNQLVKELNALLAKQYPTGPRNTD